MENNNPFELQIKKMQATAPEGLGENSNMPDNAEEELKKIQNVIPQEADNNLEEGFQKMMNILEKTAPKMPEEGQVKKEKPKVKKAVALEKAISTKTDDDAKALTNINIDETSTSTATSLKNKSEELGLNYKDEEILPLIDSLLTKGYASETTTLRGYNITFRTSYLWEDQEVVSRTDAKASELTLNASGSFFYDIYSLAANLEQFGANYFKPISKGSPSDLQESFNARVEFIEGLSSPFVNILMRKKLEFLKKVQFLLDNYDRLLQAF